MESVIPKTIYYTPENINASVTNTIKKILQSEAQNIFQIQVSFVNIVDSDVNLWQRETHCCKS
jgi:hypothetical protein